MQVNPLEEHVTSGQVAEAWGCSVVSVYRIFEDEPGVMKLGAMTDRRRTRRELRIPKSVLERVYLERVNRR